jgi:hypothetical protein
MLLTTVCTITIRSVPLAWVLRVDDACREQGGWINIAWAQGTSGTSLPGFLVLGVGFVPRNFRLRRASLFGFSLRSLGSRSCRHDASAVLGRGVSTLQEVGVGHGVVGAATAGGLPSPTKSYRTDLNVVQADGFSVGEVFCLLVGP